jgi:ankyrin repeat protein
MAEKQREGDMRVIFICILMSCRNNVRCYVFQNLLMFCCVITTPAQRGWTPLISAALNGYADCVHLLLNAGADKNAKTGVRVHCCILSGLLLCTSFLLLDFGMVF